MRVLPITGNCYCRRSLNQPEKSMHTQNILKNTTSFKGGGTKVMLGFLAGAGITLAASILAGPAIILGAGAAAVGGALLGDSIGNNEETKKRA